MKWKTFWKLLLVVGLLAVSAVFLGGTMQPTDAPAPRK